MTTTYYNNLPQPSKTTSDSSQATLQVFDTYTTAPLNIDATTYDAMCGYFTSRGFGEDAARSMAYVIIKQAILDKYNPFELIETLKGLTDIEISSLITEILNYNRYKTSSLGTASPFTPIEEVSRNIVA
jgi:hypothetical protein